MSQKENLRGQELDHLCHQLKVEVQNHDIAKVELLLQRMSLLLGKGATVCPVCFGLLVPLLPLTWGAMQVPRGSAAPLDAFEPSPACTLSAAAEGGKWGFSARAQEQLSWVPKLTWHVPHSAHQGPAWELL